MKRVDCVIAYIKAETSKEGEYEKSFKSYLNYELYIFLGLIFNFRCFNRPVTVAERPKACTVFARSEARIVGSNRTQGMDV
jgi:hypothetical protein